MRTRIHDFINALRTAGIHPSVSESIDAARALRVAGVERASLRHALAATLAKSEADRSKFDQVFDVYFALPRRPQRRNDAPAAAGGAGGQGKLGGGESIRPSPTQDEPASPRNATPPHDHHATAPAPAGETAKQRNAPTRRENGARLAKTPFEEMTAAEAEACDVLAAEMARRFRTHVGRRLEAARRRRIDIRRTLRRSLACGGVPLNPAFRRRRPGRPSLVVLCDYSHSVSVASRFLLSLVVPVQCFFRRVSLLAFVNEPVEVSLEQGHLVPHGPLDLYARSDFGAVLVRLRERHAHRFDRNTLLLILGDARNNRRPPRGDVLRQLRRASKRVIWLNPESRRRWNTADSVMHTYAPDCDAVIAAANPQELRDALFHVVVRA